MKRIRKIRDVFYMAVGITSAALLLGLVLSFILVKDKDYSSREKRMLSGFPAFTAENVASGKFMDKLEDYAKDQFFARDAAADLRNGIKLLTGDRESNGVLLLQNQRLAERFVMQDMKEREAMLNEISDFSARNEKAQQIFLLAPTAIWLYADEAPTASEPGDQDAYIDLIYRLLPERMTRLDVREAFLREKDQTELYYRTDHHWTTEGAKIAAELLLKKLGITPDFPKESGAVSNTFMGTLAAKSGFRSVRADAVTVYKIESNPDSGFYFTVTYTDEQKMTASVYSAEALQTDNPYDVFFGGNHAEIEIKTSRETLRRLLVVKDSYANAVIPFLIPYFDEITVVDPRYYQGNIDELTAEAEFTDIVFIYNANTLSQDTSLEMVLRNDQ